jgi:hypothetical protein
MQGFSPVFCFSLAFIIPDMYLLFSIYRTFTLAEEGLNKGERNDQETSSACMHYSFAGHADLPGAGSI